MSVKPQSDFNKVLKSKKNNKKKCSTTLKSAKYFDEEFSDFEDSDLNMSLSSQKSDNKSDEIVEQLLMFVYFIITTY